MAQKKSRNKFNQRPSKTSRSEDKSKKESKSSQEGKKSSPFFRHALLLVASIVSVLLIRNLPKNKNWEDTRIKRFLEEKETHGVNMDSTYRYNLINGGVANVIKFLSENIKEEQAIFLLPPQEFLVEKAYNSSNPKEFFFWVSPSYFKNHSLGKVDFVLASDPDSLLQEADYTFWANNGNLTLLKLDNQPLKDSVINTFKTKRQHAFFSANEAQKYLQTLKNK